MTLLGFRGDGGEASATRSAVVEAYRGLEEERADAAAVQRAGVDFVRTFERWRGRNALAVGGGDCGVRSSECRYRVPIQAISAFQGFSTHLRTWGLGLTPT